MAFADLVARPVEARRTLVELLDPIIDATIQRLNNKNFPPDPIAGPHFSRIVSVMSSAYKRHGYILQRAILEQLRTQSELTVWEEPLFQVSQNADGIATGALANPASIVGNELRYGEVHRALQVDLIVYHHEARTLEAYEIKRGFGNNDSGKRRQLLRDVLCVQLLLKSYGQQKGFDPITVSSHVIFYYDNLSLPSPIGIRGSELDEHFGFPVRDAVETVNARFKDRLFSILAG
jgi:hypothetical protein